MISQAFLTTLTAGILSITATAQNASLGVLHGIPGLPAPVEVFANNGRLFAFDYSEFRGPLSLPPATYNVEVRLQGNPVLQASPTLAAGKSYTAVAHLKVGTGIALSAFENDITNLAAGKARLIVRHLADAPAIDVIAQRSWRPSVRLFSNVSNPQQGVVDVDATTYMVSLNAAGTNRRAFGPVSLRLAAGKVYSVHAIGKLGTPSFQLSVQSQDAKLVLRGSTSGTSCGGNIALSTSTIELGQPFDVRLASAKPNAAGLLHMGMSKDRLVFVPLPLDLGFLGLDGCSLYQSTEVIMPITVSASGAASKSITIPTSAGGNFRGAYFQYSYLDIGSDKFLKLTQLASVER